MNKNLMCVILDLGCTKAMGSRTTINAFCAACTSYDIHCELMPTHSFFSFANNKTTVAWEKCRIHFPTTPPCHTDVDICEEGNVPILMSLPQMRKLYFTITMTLDPVYLNCPAFGDQDTPALMATSQHVVLNLADIKFNPNKAI